ncbi:MAG: hypothetical protein KF690_00275 [Bacteroidetes bacterium]|nr:hypothetical protein [Bacteroidota bacterium]
MANAPRIEAQLETLEAAVARLLARVAELEQEKAEWQAAAQATPAAEPVAGFRHGQLPLPASFSSPQELRQWLDRILEELDVCIQSLKA